MGNLIFITGASRSGTTLLQQLVDGHAGARVSYQCFPYLFFSAKGLFLESQGRGGVERPLEQYFGPGGSRLDDLRACLRKEPLPSQALRQAYLRVRGYSGMEDLGLDWAGWLEGQPARPFAAWYAAFAAKALGQGGGLLGDKEIFAEEFLPSLAEAGVKCLLVLRDPRDMLASQNLGKGEHFVGKPYPTLFNLRNWRKSAAFALELDGHENFLWLRYEELAARPALTLARVAAFLGLPDWTPQELADPRDRDGKPWHGNSSQGHFSGISAASVGKFRQAFEPDFLRYVETLCAPELRALGMEQPEPGHWPAVAAFHEPFEMARPGFAAGFSSSPENLELERRRLEALREGRFERDLFLSEKVFNKLSATD